MFYCSCSNNATQFKHSYRCNVKEHRTTITTTSQDAPCNFKKDVHKNFTACIHKVTKIYLLARNQSTKLKARKILKISSIYQTIFLNQSLKGSKLFAPNDDFSSVPYFDPSKFQFILPNSFRNTTQIVFNH